MANNDGYFDVNPFTEAALKNMREANSIVLSISKNIDAANALIRGAKTPAASDSAIKALNDQIVAQEKAIGKLQSAYAKLSEEQKKTVNDQNAAAKATLKQLEYETKNRQALDNQRQKAYADQAREAKAAVDASNKIIAQKEKEFKQFEKEFNRYEAGLAKKAIAAEKAAQKEILANEKVRLAAEKAAIPKKTVQQTVDNSILLQQQKQNATIISEVAGAYRKLSAEEARSARAVQDLISRGRLATQTQRQFNAEVKKAQTEFDGYRKRVLAADAAVGRWQRTGTRTLAGANELAGALGISLGITGVVALGKAIFDTTRELQGLDLALKQVMGSQEDAAKTQEFLSGIAEAYGVNVQVLTRSYIGFFASAKNAIDEGKITGEQINQIFESVAKAAGALGLSVDQQQGAFLAIQQMISKGNIQAEELRGQLSERLPGAFGILAKSMGVTEIQLNKMLKDGKVLAAEVLPAFAKQLEIAYGVENLQRVETLNASVARLGNSWTDFVKSLNEGDGVFSSVLVGLTDKLAEAIGGASIILQSEESKRNERLSAIRNEAYKNTLAYYSSLENIDKAEIVRKRIQHLETIKQLQDQVRANKEGNDEIRRLANSGNYVPNAPEMLKQNQLSSRRLNNQIKAYYGMIAAGDAILQKNNKTIAKNTELTKEQLKAIEDAARKTHELELARAELDLQVINRTLEDEDVYYTTRLRALELYRIKELEILNIKYKENLRRANGDYTTQQLALVKYHSDVLKSIESFNKEKEKLESLRLKEGGLATSKLAKNAQDELNASALKNIEILEKQVEAEKKHKEGLELLKKAMQEYVEGFSESFFANAGLSTWFDILNDKIIGFGENAAVTALAVTEAFQEMYNFLAQASSDNFDKERENLEKEKNLSIKFAGENDDAVKAIEEQAERRRREIAIREAKAKKDLALFNAIVDTAQAVVSELAKGGYAAAIIAAAFGAAQIAIISSTDIPQYWKGTENAPGGLAWTQERGAEAIFSKDGKLKSKGSDKGATLTKLEKGDIVKDANWTRKHLMFDNGLNNILSNTGISMPSVNFNNDNSQLISEMRSVKSAIENIPQPIMSTDNDRLSNFISIQNKNQVKVNARLRGQGKTFKRG